MTQIAILTRTFDGVVGGVEKMVLSLAKGLTDEGHKVTVISLDSLESNAFFEWPMEVDWEKLNIGNADLKAGFKVRIRRVMAIRKIFKMRSIDVVVGFQIGSFALARFSAAGLDIHCIAAERNSPTLFKFIRFGKLKRIISQIILCSASKVTVQFENYKKLYPKIIQHRILVTPNPVKSVSSSANLIRHGMQDATNIRLLYVGRFSYQKNIECLIRAFSLLPDTFQLTLLGPGSIQFICSYSDLKAFTRIHAKEENMNLQEVYLGHDIFCLSSRFEGFPNVVGEALAHGMPVVGFAGCSGLPELITAGINGEIAIGNNDHQTLSEAILRASKKVYDPKIISESISKYTFENFVNSWISAIEFK